MRYTALLAIAVSLQTLPNRGIAGEHILQNGKWHLFDSPNAVSKTVDYFIASVATAKSGLFSLRFKSVLHSYYFEMNRPGLEPLPYNNPVPLTIRIALGEPFGVLGASLGTGQVIVEERLHNAAFQHLLVELYGPETGVGISVGSLQWVFSLVGFSGAADELGRRCGFTPLVAIPHRR